MHSCDFVCYLLVYSVTPFELLFRLTTILAHIPHSKLDCPALLQLHELRLIDLDMPKIKSLTKAERQR